MIKVGQDNCLKILRETSVGLYLGDEEGEDILLPNKYVPENFEIDQEIEVFVYRDYADRKIATTLVPKIKLHQFAFLKVAAVSKVGAFMDWGLEKDLLVPFTEQRQRMQEDRWYVVYLDLEEETDRLFASNKLDKYIKNDELDIAVNDEVDLIIRAETKLGYNAIINHKFQGLIFDSDIYQDIRVGEEMKGYIKNIRPDNKIDISLQPLGYQKSFDVNSDRIMEILEENGGFMPYNDKSDPDDIADEFGMSKKAFKKAIGGLYKSKLIQIEERGISKL